nr:MAG TPA: tail protein [Caudoviricetes sp.]
MELKICDKANNLRLTASPNSSSSVTEEIGGECSVSASFTHTEYVPLDVDDYIEVEGVRYKVKSRYRPKQKNTQTYEYSVKFYAPIHDAEDTLMLFQEGGTTSEFSYDGGPREHLQLWIDNMNRRAGGNLWSIGTVITAENKVIDYRNVKCWDAAFARNGIAATFDTEMWADGYVINLCKAERGEVVELGYLKGLTNLAQEDNGEVKFFTRLFPLGSTRNIDATKYGYSRLQLPSREIYVDKNVDLYGVKEETEEAAFAEIYPQYVGTVSSVRTEEKTSEEGRKYTVYYFKDNGMTWNPKDYEIPDLDYMLQFQTGELAGRGTDGSFQAAWHEDTREWEIINVYPDETTQIPGGVIIPNPGDKYIPWNFAMPQEYITAAEQAYKQAVDDYLATYSFDPNKYTGTTDRNYIEKNNTPLRIGWNVRLLSEQYFGSTGGYKDTRITKVQRKLNDLCQATITCSDEVGSGWKSSVDNSLNSLRYEVARQAEQYVYDVIRSFDEKTPSDKNIFSALKSLKTHLRKDAPDRTEFLMKLLGGIISPFLTSPDFVTGMMGAGMSFSSEEGGESVGWIDKLYVRKKAILQLLSIMETELAGASMMFNSSGARATITKVERIDAVPFFYSDGSAKYYSDGSRAYVQPSAHGAVYRCYFLADDGEKAIENRFRVGNLVRSQSFNIKSGVYENVSNHYWWRLVTAVGDNWIEVSVNHCDEGSDIPAVGDVMVQLGDISDTDFQAAVVLSAYGDGAPSLTFYHGINSYSLSGKDIVSIGYDRLTKEGYFNVYGRAYIGNREQTNYLSLSDGKLVGRFSELMLSSGKSVVEVAKEEISLELEDTGINVKDRTVTVHADNFFVTNTSGEPIAVFTTDKNGRPIVKAEYIDVDNLKVKHLDGAEGSLERGSIGGFELANGRIGSEATASGGGGSLSIYSDMIRVGGTSSYVLIGKNVVPATASGFTAAGRIINNQTNTYGGYGFDVANYGLFIEVSGGTKNYGLKSNAPLMATAFIGTKIGRLNITGSTYKIDFSQNNIFFIYASSAYNVTLPDESQVASMFGMSSLPSDFGLMLVFRCLVGSKNVTLAGIYDQNGSVQSYTLAVGDSIILLVAKVPYFGYFLINYTS